MDQQLAGGVTSGEPVRFEIPDEIVRPFASKLAASPAVNANAADENWYAAKLEIFERPGGVVQYVESRPDQVVGFRSPTVQSAFEQIRRWQRRQPTARHVQSQAGEGTRDFFPDEWIRVLAYRRFEKRGRQHGHDKEDWFAAKAELFEYFVPLMLRDIWSAELCDSLRQKPVDQAIEYLRELHSQTPRLSGPRPNRPDLRIAQTAPAMQQDAEGLVLEPDRTSSELLVTLHRKDREIKMRPEIKTIEEPTKEDLARARITSSPIAALSDDEFEKYRGCLVALLADGREKGKVIAHAPANAANPRQPREAISSQVRSSQYRNCRYVVQQILMQPATE